MPETCFLSWITLKISYHPNTLAIKNSENGEEDPQNRHKTWSQNQTQYLFMYDVFTALFLAIIS